MSRTPVQALLDFAARSPEEPWLFRHEGWRWHWISFGAAAHALETVVSSGGREAGFALILDDLTRQAAGEPVVVRGREGGLELTGEDLAAAAQSITSLIPAAPPGRREILVLGTDLADPAQRALFSWGTVAGAALVLEPDPANRVGTAVWSRPTLFAGSANEAARLRIAAQRHEGRFLRRLLRTSPGLPFGRLRTVLVTGPDPLPPEDEAFWRDRGAAVWFLPQCGIAGI